MIRTEAAGRAVALLAVVLAVAAQSAVVGNVANGDTDRSGLMIPGLVTTEPFGARHLDDALTVSNLNAPAVTTGSNDTVSDRFTVVDASMGGDLEGQVRGVRFDWPQNLDASGAPIELRQEHLAPLMRLSF